MFVHRVLAAMQEHDFLAVGSSVLLEGMGQKGYGMLNNENQIAAFESQEPKYVKILKFDYFLSFLRSSFHPKFRLQNSIMSCVSPYDSLGSGNSGGSCVQPDIGWHLSEITEGRKKKNQEKEEGNKTTRNWDTSANK